MPARALCQRLGETPQRFVALLALWVFYLVRGRLQQARELGEQLLRLAHNVNDPVFLLSAHVALGPASFYVAELDTARAHLEQSIALYLPQQHHVLAFLYGQDVGVSARSYLAWVLWQLGYPEQARRRAEEALSLARQLSRPYSHAFSLAARYRCRCHHNPPPPWHSIPQWRSKGYSQRSPRPARRLVPLTRAVVGPRRLLP
ncbi:MAG: tetratricopeptide repeat protein [Thermodesulfobacteriota bacterium]